MAALRNDSSIASCSAAISSTIHCFHSSALLFIDRNTVEPSDFSLVCIWKFYDRNLWSRIGREVSIFDFWMTGLKTQIALLTLVMRLKGQRAHTDVTSGSDAKL